MLSTGTRHIIHIFSLLFQWAKIERMFNMQTQILKQKCEDIEIVGSLKIGETERLARQHDATQTQEAAPLPPMHNAHFVQYLFLATERGGT